MRTLVLLLALLLLQDDPQELIRRLGSDDLAARDAAYAAIKKMGRAAVPHLETAAGDKDVELAARAKRLIEVIGLLETLPPKLREALPGIEEKLAGEDHYAWTRAFLEATARGPDLLRRHPSLGRSECRALVERALRGAKAEEEFSDVCRAIADHAIPGAEEQLADTLGTDTKALTSASRALKTLRAHSVIPRLLASLPRAKVRYAIVEALVELQAPREGVLALLDHSHGEVRGAGLTVAGELDYVTSPILEKMLKDPSSHVRNIATGLVGKLERREFIPVLRGFLKARGLRKAAAKVLLDFKDTESLPDIVPLAKTPIEDAREIGIRAIGMLPGDEALPQLLPFLKDTSGDEEDAEDMRRAAVWTMANLRGEKVRTYMRKALEGPEKDLQRCAIAALARMGDKESYDAIERLAGDKMDWIIAETLFTLDRERAMTDFAKRLEDDRASANMVVAGVLLNETGAAAVPAIARLLDHKDADVRSRAVRLLGDWGDARYAVAVAARIEDEDENVRVQAVLAAGALRAASAVPALRRLLGAEGAEYTRTYVATALANIGATSALAEVEAIALQEQAEEGNVLIAMSLVSAASRLGSRKAASRLLDLFTCFDVFEQHLSALNAVRQPEAWQRLHQAPYENRGGTVREELQRIAAGAGLTLQLTPGSLRSEAIALERPAFASADRKTRTLLTALEALADGDRYTFVLEPKTLRVLPCDAAFDEWLKWSDTLR